MQRRVFSREFKLEAVKFWAATCGRVGGGSGLWWPKDFQARTRRLRWGYRSRLVSGGFVRRAGWRPLICRGRPGRPQDGICHLRSARRWRYIAKAIAARHLPKMSGALRRR